jgi:CelD/BcsL family acetyltransferase involved in cellulose biosynthesis
MALRASISREWGDAEAAWKGQPAVILTPFQATHWLSSWYRTIGRLDNVKPLIVTISDDQAPLATFPLISTEANNAQVIEFADLGVTDYNSIIWSQRMESKPLLAQSVWQQFCRSVSGEGDFVCLTKMPVAYEGKRNPLAAVRGIRPFAQNTNTLRVDGSWEDYHRGLPRKFRKELERSWRVFLRDGEPARFERAETAGQAHEFLECLASYQRRRLNDGSTRYILDDCRYAEFYAELITEDAIRNGEVVLTALIARENIVVAVLMGICRLRMYSMVRLGHNIEEWRQCSPGRTIIERTMINLHEGGVRVFDFTIGNYKYKEAFILEQDPLFEVVHPITMRGRLIVGKDDARNRVRKLVEGMPRVKQAIKYLRGSRAAPV